MVIEPVSVTLPVAVVPPTGVEFTPTNCSVTNWVDNAVTVTDPPAICTVLQRKFPPLQGEG